MFGWDSLQVSSFRESKSDDRRFYIFTSTKTLHLRTNSKKERAAWIEALISTRNLFQLRPLNDNFNLLQNDVSISTERLKKRLLDEGIGEGLVNDCEQIMLSEFSEIKGQLKSLCDERSNLLDTLSQLEVTLLLSPPNVHTYLSLYVSHNALLHFNHLVFIVCVTSSSTITPYLV